jgi:hypothetical protein
MFVLINTVHSGGTIKVCFDTKMGGMDNIDCIYVYVLILRVSLSVCMNMCGWNSGMSPYDLTGGHHISDETPDFICALMK